MSSNIEYFGGLGCNAKTLTQRHSFKFSEEGDGPLISDILHAKSVVPNVGI